jgi:hypothetical protein
LTVPPPPPIRWWRMHRLAPFFAASSICRDIEQYWSETIATLGGAIARVVGNSSHVDSRTAGWTGNARYAPDPVPARPPGWGDLAVDSTVALAPAAASAARLDTQDAPTLSDRSQGGYDEQTPTRVPVTASYLNVAAEVRDLLSRMARPANPRTVRLLVAIEPDITRLANPPCVQGNSVAGDFRCDGSMDVRLVPGGGSEATLTLTAALAETRRPSILRLT